MSVSMLYLCCIFQRVSITCLEPLRWHCCEEAVRGKLTLEEQWGYHALQGPMHMPQVKMDSTYFALTSSGHQPPKLLTGTNKI